MPRAKKGTAKESYHHGDLRRALLEASVQLIARDGVEALSLREVAQRVGVSPAAPYHHFSNKAQLLGAIAATGFDGLAQAMDQAVAKSPPGDPIARLRALGEAYVAFALARPTEFRLMFRPGLVSDKDLPPDCTPDRTFGALMEALAAVAPLLPPGLIRPEALTLAAWAIVHGAAELVLDGPLGTPGEGPMKLPPQRVGPLVVEAFTTLLQSAASRRR